MVSFRLFALPGARYLEITRQSVQRVVALKAPHTSPPPVSGHQLCSLTLECLQVNVPGLLALAPFSTFCSESNFTNGRLPSSCPLALNINYQPGGLPSSCPSVLNISFQIRAAPPSPLRAKHAKDSYHHKNKNFESLSVGPPKRVTESGKKTILKNIEPTTNRSA